MPSASYLIYITNSTYGNRLDGVVVEVTDTQMKMDFNHPLGSTERELTVNARIRIAK